MVIDILPHMAWIQNPQLVKEYYGHLQWEIILTSLSKE